VEGFTRINDTLINTKRLLIIEHKPEATGGRLFVPEHYRAVFDTGQVLMLTPEEGKALMPPSVTDKAVSG
jgi:hypothetical protein